MPRRVVPVTRHIRPLPTSLWAAEDENGTLLCWEAGGNSSVWSENHQLVLDLAGKAAEESGRIWTVFRLRVVRCYEE